MPIHEGFALNLLSNLRSSLFAVILGFTISGIYWASQQRQLATTISVAPRQAVLHFMFLFLIVSMPVSTSLFGTIGAEIPRPAVLIYGAHLSLLALVYLLLWMCVHRSAAVHWQVVRSSLALLTFLIGLARGALRPPLAQYIWLSVFAIPLLNRKLARLFHKI